MSSSKVWVNQEFVDQKRRIKKNKKERYSVSREKVKAAKETPNKSKATKVSHEPINQGTPNLLETLGKLSTMAQNMDLAKIRNQLTEINQIVDQVNGVIQGFQQQNSSSYPLPYTQQSMYSQQNPRYQPPYGKQHPYSSYRPK